MWVYFTRDRMPSHAYNKLKAKKIRPLVVLERINDNAYVSFLYSILIYYFIIKQFLEILTYLKRIN